MKMLMIIVGAASALAYAQSTQPASTDHSLKLNHAKFVITLSAPLSATQSKAGDAFTAAVESPSKYSGAQVEGHLVRVIKPEPGVGKSPAIIQFAFDTMTFRGEVLPVEMDLKGVIGVEHVKKVDNEGNVTGKATQKKRVGSAIAGGILGAGIGWAAGGAAGAAIGGAAGAGAGTAAGTTMTSTGYDLVFSPGAKLVLTVSDAKEPRAEKLPMP
jgi:hypothetical protein